MSDTNNNEANKKPIQEKLALQRTIMANQTTLLSFLRTGMYFVVAGLSMKNLLKVDHAVTFEVLFYVAAGIILGMGIFNYFYQKRRIKESKDHIVDGKDKSLDS
jgi:putative membrane protein